MMKVKLIKESLLEFHKGEDPMKSLGLGKYSTYVGKVEDTLKEALHACAKFYPEKWAARERTTKFLWADDYSWLLLFFPNTSDAASSIFHSIMNSTPRENIGKISQTYYGIISNEILPDNKWISVYTEPLKKTLKNIGGEIEKDILSKKDIIDSFGPGATFLMIFENFKV